MHHIVYLSQATHELSPVELVALLQQARERNTQHLTTGALVYGDGQFMQVMEGERAAVEALYKRLERDPHHRNLFRLADKTIAERSFATWSMAFREISPSDFAYLTGYASPAQWAQLAFASTCADTLFNCAHARLIARRGATVIIPVRRVTRYARVSTRAKDQTLESHGPLPILWVGLLRSGI